MVLKTKKITYLVSFFCLILFSNLGNADELLEKKYFLTNEIVELISSNPDQAIKIAQHLLSKPSITNQEKAKINFLLAKCYIIKGDYSSALNFLYDQKNFKGLLTPYEDFCVELYKVFIYRSLDLDLQAQNKLKEIEEAYNVLPDLEYKRVVQLAIAIQKAKQFCKKKEFDKGISILLQCKINEKLNDQYDDTINLWYSTALGDLYIHKKEYNKASTYFQLALQKTATYKRHNGYIKILAQLGLSKIYSNAKDYQKTNLLLVNALKSADALQNVQLKKQLLNRLSANYFNIGDLNNYQLTSSNFIEIDKEIESADQEALNTAYNLISQELLDKNEDQKQSYYNFIYVQIGLFLFVLLVLVVLIIRINQKKYRLIEIIKYLEITRRNFLSVLEVPKLEVKKIAIPKETEQLLLNKLKKFETSTKFTNKDLSLAVLAGQFDTNTKYLSEIINSNYNINFNTYINRLRINYIIQKLKSDPNYKSYKISYLAENSGFSSHSSFATVFKSITGISPVTFIELLRSENEQSEQ